MIGGVLDDQSNEFFVVLMKPRLARTQVAQHPGDLNCLSAILRSKVLPNGLSGGEGSTGRSSTSHRHLPNLVEKISMDRPSVDSDKMVERYECSRVTARSGIGSTELKGADLRHVRKTIEELRRYIAESEDRADLEEVDTLLDVALEEVRAKIKAKRQAEERSLPPR
jgi:hypothetical protein